MDFKDAIKRLFDINGLMLLSTSLLLFLGCSKEEDEPAGNIPERVSLVKLILNDSNLNPSNREQITYIGHVADSVSYKLSLGRKNGHAWMAKFSPNGDEIFSLEVKEPLFDYKYSHFNVNSIVSIFDDFIFIRGWYNYWEDPYSPDFGNSIVDAFLLMVDFKSGKQIKKIDSGSGEGIYQVEKATDSYFVSEGPNANYQNEYVKFYMINSEKTKWSRDCKNYESYKGIQYYNRHIFIDDEILCYTNTGGEYTKIIPYSVGGSKCIVLKIINLKDSELIRDFDYEEIPFHFSNEGDGFFHKIKDIGISESGFIHFFYSEYKRVVEQYDPISGEGSEYDEFIENYRYDIDISDYSIKSHIRLSDMTEVED